MITLTKERIESCESLGDSYTKATLLALGADLRENGSPIEGWKERLIGSKITSGQYAAALAGRSNNFYARDFEKKQLSLF